MTCTKAEYSTKTGLGSFNFFYQPPHSLILSEHYCEAATKDNVLEYLKKPQFKGIILRPSSQKNYTTLSYIDGEQIANIPLANQELNSLNKTFLHYHLDLGAILIALASSFLKKEDILDEKMQKHLQIGLEKKLADAKKELYEYSRKKAEGGYC